MTAPTPDQRAAWRRHADEDGYVSLGVYELHALLDALDAAERREAEWSRRFEEWQSNNLTSWVERAERAEAALARVEAEVHHAADNGHILDRDCQGVAPGERVPAVRLADLRAALDGSDA